MSSKQIQVEVPSDSRITIEGDLDKDEKIVVETTNRSRPSESNAFFVLHLWRVACTASNLLCDNPGHVATFINAVLVILVP